ncbi:MAG TPA: aldehyde dehydrogenase family protein [Eoetvoesiella sp.]
MMHLEHFYIDGKWVDPVDPYLFDVINPSTEKTIAQIAMGNALDVDRAVKAARAAFLEYSESPVAYRVELLKKVLDIYKRRYDEFAELISQEMGAPITFSKSSQAIRGVAHLTEIIKALEQFEFEAQTDTTLIRHEAIGVCSLITPWNWPVNQVMVKVAPALAAGCTVILKPSEYSPLSALLFAEVIDEAGVPPGVFNLINGDGANVGARMSSHPDVEMVSFTGSTQAGIKVALSAAETVKRVTQELGGKSANILLDDVDLVQAVSKGVAACFTNSGQSCSIPTRMLIPAHLMDEAIQIAKKAADQYVVGPANDPASQLGPVVNSKQFSSIQGHIQSGISDGATLVTGGLGRPDHCPVGYFIKPTIFANVSPAMAIAQEEIFGPVLAMIPYSSEQEAIEIANNTEYGLAAYVQGQDLERVRRVAFKLRAGGVHLNYPAADFSAPFGGYKQSGNGREWGEHGLREYLEVKSIVGYAVE